VLPAVLQEWMVPGSRPSCLPADAIHDDLIAELKLNSLSTDGTPQECIARAELHAITVRKPAQTLTAEEWRVKFPRWVLKSASCAIK